MRQRLLERHGPLVAAVLLLILVLPSALRADDDLFIPGGEGDGPSIEVALSADGRYSAFASEATNLVPDDRNGFQDVFVYDRQTGDTLRASVGINDEESDDFSELPAISADGRWIVFQSMATNLAPYDNNYEPDIFIYDRQTEEIARVSLTSDGAQSSGGSYEPAISANGRYVAFTSSATNLDERDDDPAIDVYLHDRQTGKMELISVDTTGKHGTGYASHPSISADGRMVAFSSASADLVGDDGNEVEDVFVRDRQTDQTVRVSVRSDGEEVLAESYDPALSADGGYVAFWSYAADLTDDPTAGWWNVYIHDLGSGGTTLVSKRPDGGPADNGSTAPRLSADGRYVAFQSEATDLTGATDDNNAADVFIHDRQTGATTRVSVGDQEPGNNESGRPALTPDGGYVAFQSVATNLVADDENGASDIFLRDLTAGATIRLSLAAGEATPVESAIYVAIVMR